MLLMFVAAASASIVAAKPLSPPLTVGDYPTALAAQNRQASIVVHTLVKPNGRTESCSVVARLGDPQFEAITCAAILKRGRFKPASDSQGKPLYGLHKNVHNFWLPDMPPLQKFTLDADYVLDVKSLPGGAANLDVSINLLVDQQGKVADCAPDPDEAQARYAQAACNNIAALWTPAPLTNLRGEAIRYVRQVKIRFEPGNAGTP